MIRFAGTLAVWLMAALPAAAEIEIQEVATPGGATAWLVEENTVPFVALEIVFRGGTSLDPEGKRGAVNLMTALIEEGAGDLDAQGFARARDDLAASFRFEAQDDGIRVSARFLTETADAAVALLRSALHEPRFDPDAVERVRGQVLSGLRSDATDPDAIAARAFSETIYGDHPYATPGDGTVETVGALSRDDLIAAHRASLVRDRAYVAAAGDISAERLAEVIDILLGDLPEANTPLPAPADLRFDGGLSVVDFATPQSVISFGQPGLPRNHPDFFAAYIMSQILGGGGLGSRLMEEVRENRGLTYGIYAYLLDKDHADLLLGRTATANARAAETVQVVREEWTRMAETGPTDDEVDAAKTYLIGGYPLRFDGNDSIARILVGMQLDGLSTDYVSTRNDRIAAVTAEEVRRVAAELLDPDALSFVIVGQPEGLPPPN